MVLIYHPQHAAAICSLSARNQGPSRPQGMVASKFQLAHALASSIVQTSLNRYNPDVKALTLSFLNAYRSPRGTVLEVVPETDSVVLKM